MVKRRHIPPVFGTAELADVLGWPVRRVRRWCLRRGLGFRSKDGSRLEITYGQLLERAPDVYYALLSRGVIDSGTGADCDLT